MKKRTELNIDKINSEENDINHGLDRDDNIANFVSILSPFVNNFSNFLCKYYNMDDLTKSQIETRFKRMNFVEQLTTKLYYSKLHA